MPFTTYDELRLEVEKWSARGDLRDQIPEFIFLAELRIYRETSFRTRAVDKVLRARSFVADQGWIGLPADWYEGRFIEIQTEPLRTVEIVSPDKMKDVRQNNVTKGIPIAAMVQGLTLEVAPIPGSAYTYDIYYYGGVEHIASVAPADGTQTSYLLQRAPDLLLYGALLEMAPYTRDVEGAKLWAEDFTRGLATFRASEARARWGGGPLRVRADFGAP